MLRNDRKPNYAAPIAQKVTDPEMVRSLAFFRLGYVEYQLGCSYNPDYDLWKQKDQTNYERGRMIAANIEQAFGKERMLECLWPDPTFVPQELSDLADAAREKIGGTDPIHFTAPIEEVEAHTAGYSKRRGLPLPVPTVREE
jgi:hypothetical protein